MKGQKYHPALASEWRQLRTSGQLEGIDEDILLWQQPNAWCTAELTCRLYNRFHGWAENRNVVIVQDMAAQQWCPQAKECAKALGQPLLPVARGMTMPLQLTDAEFAQQGKASETKVKAMLNREKRAKGLPLNFTRHDMYRMVLEQHRATKQHGETHQNVVFGARRLGYLSRKMRQDGTHFDVDAHAESLRWTQHPLNGEVIRMGSSRFLPTWVEQRRALPLEPVIWEKGGAHETEVDDDACDSDGGDHLAVEVAVIGSEIVSRRLTQLAQQDACAEAFRNRRATGRIELAQKTVLRPCTCGLPIHDAKCPHNWANRYNAMIVAREKERHMKLLQDAIDGRQLNKSKKKRSIALAQMPRRLQRDWWN